MFDFSDEEQSCFKWYRWMKPRESRSNVKQYYEEKKRSAMVEPSFHYKMRSRSDEIEKLPISRRKGVTVPSREIDKENTAAALKDSEGSSNMVKRLKIRYDEISNARKSVIATSDGNSRATGAIKKRVVEEKNFGGLKKRVEFGEDKNGGAKKRDVFGEDENGGAKKRVDFGEDENGAAKERADFDENKNGGTRKRLKVNSIASDVFAKSRFKIYADEPLLVSDETVTKNLDATYDVDFDTAKHSIQDRRLNRLITESGTSIQQRFTPVDGSNVALVPKKVKVQHRKNLMAGDEKPTHHTGSISRRPTPQQLLYEDNFVKLELEKEKSLCRMSKGYRKKNITVEQRKIILKFLIRLNVHAFYPSFILYQTVKIFDAALDAKVVGVEHLQLVALTSMWIAIKREEIAYRVPTASKMISYSKDLYEGRVDLLVKCEMEILKALNFQIVFPDPFSVLYYYITTCKYSDLLENNQVELAYYCGGYMIDVSLFNDDLMETSAVLVAAAAAETALFFVADEDSCESGPTWSKWRASDAASRYSTEDIGRVRSTLIQLIEKSHHRHTDGEIIFKKYSRSRYGRVSHFLCSKVEQFLQTD